MKTFIKKQPLLFTLLIIFFVWTAFYYINIQNVPFHPDESTQIYMSEDIEQFFTDPSTLFYSKTASNYQKQTYRFLDSPLTRYTIGIWRNLSHLDSVDQDWDWSATWLENQSALPNSRLLFISRFGISVFYPISILLLFFITKKIFSQPTALLTSFLFMTNAVILLHTRRAMAEGLMLFFMLLSICAVYCLKPNKFFLSSIPIAFAINTKQSLLFLIPATLLYFLITNKFSLTLVKQIVYFLTLLIFISAILNPVLWNHPIEAMQVMVTERANLLKSQTEVIQSVSPKFVLTTPSDRLLGYIAQTFVTPPAFQDVANYHDQLKESIEKYQQNLFHIGVFRSLLPGLTLFVFSWIGFVLILSTKQTSKLLFLTFFLFALIEILVAFPIPFQRYYLPLYPFIYIFISEFIVRVIKNIKKPASNLFKIAG